MKKVLHYTAADRWFPAVKSKATAMFEWIRARREAQRKTSAQGQTYDLPKNGKWSLVALGSCFKVINIIIPLHVECHW